MGRLRGWNVWIQPDAGSDSIAHARSHALSHCIADPEVRWSIRYHRNIYYGRMGML